MEVVGEPTLVQAVRGHSSEVTCLDAAGGALVSGGGDRALRVWRWAPPTGWTEHALASRAHRFGITSVRWGPGSALVASCGVDGAVRVWSRSLRPRRLLAAPAAPAARSVCWPAPGTLLTGYDDGSVCLWEVRNSKLIARLAAHEGAVHALAAPARGSLLLAASTDAVLKVYDLQDMYRSGIGGGHSPSPLFWMDGVHDLGVLCADASEDGSKVATGGHDSKIKLWYAKGRKFDEGSTLEGHTAAVTGLRWARGVLASAALDRTARLWVAAGCVRVLLAHARYLTCVTLAPDLRYLITGSNDKSIRMWSLGNFTINDEIEPECSGLAHFGLGDLEGIGPVNDDILEAEVEVVTADEGAGYGGALRVWYTKDDHTGSVNGIATYEDLIATASSDGLVRVFRWCEDDSTLRLEHELGERSYPSMAVHFGANGALLLSAGLDGEAVVWDVKTGCRLRSLCAPATTDGESGGGGIRSVKVSPHRPPLLLLATDDGLAPIWSLAVEDPAPIHTYGGHTGAVLCCSWTSDGRILCTGSETGELRLNSPPPMPLDLYYESSAHDLGVQSCDFANNAVGFAENIYLLVTAGNDLLAKIWTVEYVEDLAGIHASVRLIKQLAAHTGAVSVARWNSSGSSLITGGTDSWARVWRVTEDTAYCCACLPAAENPAVGGIVSASFIDASTQLLVLGTLGGELILWRLPDMEEDDENEDDGLSVRFWKEPGVVRWLKEYITRVPGFIISQESETELFQKAKESSMTGTRLLDEPVDKIMESFGYTTEIQPIEEKSERELLKERLIEEIEWLRRDPLPPEVASSAPHSLKCPLTHAAMAEPVRAADGCSYDRAALHEWFISCDGAVSAVSGRRLRNARVLPNYRLREDLKQFHTLHQPG